MSNRSRQKILLVVSGMSPQIITETLYALILNKSWIPHEIRLITTEQGRRNAIQHLLEGEKYFDRLLHDYGISQLIRFDTDCITLIQDAKGNILSDLRTPEDNEAAADCITDVIRELTKDDATELHVSLAGGRKTMGFYAGYALSLFGRSQDSLSHVLVSAYYESNPHFFYPTPETRIIYTREGMELDASQARVWLAEIPFVRLRSGLPKSLLKGQRGFSETVALARKATEKAYLVISPANGRYELNGVSGTLPPVCMAILLWAANRRMPISPLVDGEKNRDYARELLSLAEQTNLLLHGKTENSLHKDGITKSFLETNISKLNKQLDIQLGPELSGLCKLAIVQRDGYSGYALPEKLEIDIQP